MKHPWPAFARARTLRASGRVAGCLALLCVWFVAGLAAPASAQSVSCHSLELQVAITPTEPAECFAGSSDDVDFKGEWEFIQMTAGDRFILVGMQRAGLRSYFYRPTLKDAVESLLDEDDDVDWGDDIEHDVFKVRRFEIDIRAGTLPCVGFVDASGQFAGAKSVVYGYICNINGLAFADSEVADMLSRIGH